MSAGSSLQIDISGNDSQHSAFPALKPKGNKSHRKGNSANGPISVKKSTQRWDSLPETNEAFVSYYKAQGIVASEEEWDELFAVLRTDLPTTFRITGSKKYVSYEMMDIL